MNSHKKILVVANTYFELFLLSSVVYLLSQNDKTNTFHLLIKPKIKSSLTPELKILYKEVYIQHFPFNPIFSDYSILNIPKIFLKTAKIGLSSIAFRNKLNNIKKEDFDVLLISSYREYFANILIDVLSEKTKKVVVRMDNSVNNLNAKKKGLASFIANTLNFIFGKSVMTFRWNEEYKGSYTCDYVDMPYDMKCNIRDDIRTTQKSDSCILVPPPFIALKKVYGQQTEERGDKKQILVIGERTPINPDWNSVGPEDWNTIPQKNYNDFLDYLRNRYGDYELIFTPHKERTDMSQLDLSGFTIKEEQMLIEDWFAKERFEKVISVKSTICKLASDFGYDSYVLYPWIGLSEKMKEYSATLYSDNTGVIRVEHLSDIDTRKNQKTTPLEDLISIYGNAIVTE